MRFLLFLLASSLLFSQEPATIKNSGAPMRVGFDCTEDDLNWAGLTCSSEEPCAIYLEVSAIVPNGRKLILSGNIHTDSATLYSILLLSEDSGETWQEPAKRVRGASLDQLQFYDLQSGWAAGETLYPLPRDPFFLVTTDGGTTWRQRPVTDDGGPGSVQRFWFDSPQHGELVIDHGASSGSDRYSQYESETGGESWNIRATTSKLPVIRRAPPTLENPDWRIRTSKDGKSYEIQRRDGERWMPLATFLVKVADCKGGQRELKEPPPQPSAEEEKASKDYVEELKLKTTDPKSPPTKKKKP